jgi:hypothetical protein
VSGERLHIARNARHGITSRSRRPEPERKTRNASGPHGERGAASKLLSHRLLAAVAVLFARHGANPTAGPRVGAQFASPVGGYLWGMDPASIFIIIVVLVVAVGLGVFFLFTGAGLEMREGRRRRGRARPEHLRVENEQHAVSSPAPSPRPPEA